MKKVLMKDIAKMANVSLATVSYILNNVEGQSISLETKNRVKKIALELNYVPNLSARSLASNKSKLIGIMVVKDYLVHNPWMEGVYSKFINKVEQLLNEKGYHILLFNIDVLKPELNVILQRQLDAVMIIDVSEDIFYKISNYFNCPIILINSFFEDDLFTKIVMDYERAIKKAKLVLGEKLAFLIADKVNNKGVMDKIIQSSGLGENDILFVSSEKELERFINKHQNEKGIVVNEYLSLVAAKYLEPSNIVVIGTSQCPELLSKEVNRITFESNMPNNTVNLIISYIKGSYPEIPNKYLMIEVI